MPAQPLSPDQLVTVLRVMQEHGGNATAAALSLGMPRGTFVNRVRTAQMALAEGTIEPPEPLPPPVDPMVKEPLSSFEEAWAQWSRCIGRMRESVQQPPSFKSNERQKILVIPDLHAPFHEPELFAAMLAREADADRAICIGDLSDSYSLSTFTQYRSMPFSEEWAHVTACMQALSEAFPRVDVIIGNHDARLEKRLRERLTPDMVEAVKYLANGSLCPITALARRFDNVHVARHEVPGGETVDWFTTVGDAWLGHPEKYSRLPANALRAVEEWLVDNELALGFLEPFRLIVMGHTHQMSWIPWRADKLLVECGCLCQTQGYMLKPKIGGRPQRRGYVTFVQHNGQTDLNSVRMHWFDMEAVA